MYKELAGGTVFWAAGTALAACKFCIAWDAYSEFPEEEYVLCVAIVLAGDIVLPMEDKTLPEKEGAPALWASVANGDVVAEKDAEWPGRCDSTGEEKPG